MIKKPVDVDTDNYREKNSSRNNLPPIDREDDYPTTLPKNIAINIQDFIDTAGKHQSVKYKQAAAHIQQAWLIRKNRRLINQSLVAQALVETKKQLQVLKASQKMINQSLNERRAQYEDNAEWDKASEVIEEQQRLLKQWQSELQAKRQSIAILEQKKQNKVSQLLALDKRIGHHQDQRTALKHKVTALAVQQQSILTTLLNYYQLTLPTPQPTSVTRPPTSEEILAIIDKAQLDYQLSELLYHVAAGEQGKAKALLDAQPLLILAKGTVTDLSKRTFQNITAFQYAAWALDWEMWEMIKPYFDQVPRGKESHVEQILALKKGSWVTGADGATTHGETAEVIIQQLIDAYETLDEMCQLLHTARRYTLEQLDEYWVQQVGKKQLLLPAHAMYDCLYSASSDSCDFTKKHELFASNRHYSYRYEAGRGWLCPEAWQIGIGAAIYCGRPSAKFTQTVYMAGSVSKRARELLAARISQYDKLVSSSAPQPCSSSNLPGAPR